MSYQSDTFQDAPADALNDEYSAITPRKAPAPAIVHDYATGAQKQAIIDELCKRQSRYLTTKICLNINRYTEAQAAALLAGGLDEMEAKHAAQAA